VPALELDGGFSLMAAYLTAGKALISFGDLATSRDIRRFFTHWHKMHERGFPNWQIAICCQIAIC
jgi:hypothetical protein